MEYDCKCKRGKFIDSSTSIRETFGFAEKQELLRAVQIHCCDLYGSMLWNLFSKQDRCRNTCTKLCWYLPSQTHSYFVDNLLSCGLPSIRQQVLSRYVKFYHTLVSSPSKEVALVARIVGKDASTNTGHNLVNIYLETSMCPIRTPMSKLKTVIFRPAPPPPCEMWRIDLLQKYIQIRQNQILACEDTSYIDEIITSLCST